MPGPLISIVTPTYRRQALLARQHQNVLAQSEQDFEWLILDDSPEPSEYFTRLSDPRIRYIHHAGAKLSVGAKRNWLAEQAKSEIIVHFDDDDYYAPDYLKTMRAQLAARGADFTKLSGWFVYTVRYTKLGYWDTTRAQRVHFSFSPEPIEAVGLIEPRNHLLGYGFTYAYRKAVWRSVPFPDLDANEDLSFVTGAIAKGARVDHFADTQGLCLHILREDNLSSSFPQYMLPDFMLENLFPPAVRTMLAP